MVGCRETGRRQLRREDLKKKIRLQLCFDGINAEPADLVMQVSSYEMFSSKNHKTKFERQKYVLNGTWN